MSFDLESLYRDVADERQRRGLSWSELSRKVGVSATTIRRFSKAEDAEADGVLAMVRWLEVAPERYIVGSSRTENLAEPGDGVVRVDMARVREAQGDTHGDRGRSRTTIQRLVAAAQQAECSVASLTRLSET